VNRIAAAVGRRAASIRARIGRSRWGRLPRSVRILSAFGAAVVLLVGFTAATVVGTSVAVGLYDVYGYHPEKNAASWASLPPVYANTSSCAACHSAQYAPWALAKHSTVSCETCHGPLAEHAADPEAVKPDSLIAASSASSNLCARCHAEILGRPAAFAQQDLSTHYRPWACDRCHDPHTASGTRPPLVSHPLANLPACTICHGFNALKPMPRTHDEATDAVCLGCHKPDTTSGASHPATTPAASLPAPEPAAQPAEETAP
jgi:hypothetical protein